jgi:pyroglutamyl-peptidase
MTDTPDNTILLAGFEPFGDFATNPSQLVVETLDGRVINGCTVRGVVLPVVFGEAGDRLLEALEKTRPKAVVCLGLAADRKDISIERLAVNLDDARMPDNAGNLPVDQVIVPGAPPACWATLPVKNILADLSGADIAASLSMSAGTYVCNHVFFRLLVALQENPSARGGFIHVPPLSGSIDDALPVLVSTVSRILSTVVGET